MVDFKQTNFYWALTGADREVLRLLCLLWTTQKDVALICVTVSFV